jgi:DNA-directed RNA polymerase subunit RPC12/RpoP
MPVRHLDPEKFRERGNADSNADWWGNNAAFACPICSKVFVTSSFPEKYKKEGRQCPACGQSRAFVTGDTYGGEARIEWD